MILKGRRKKLADWPVKGVLAHIAGPIPGGWRVIDVLAIASGFQPIWQKAQASFERGRDSRGEAENFSTCEIYQVLEIGAREADRLTGAAGPAAQPPMYPNANWGLMDLRVRATTLHHEHRGRRFERSQVCL
jgi:hypothetical protein